MSKQARQGAPCPTCGHVAVARKVRKPRKGAGDTVYSGFFREAAVALAFGGEWGTSWSPDVSKVRRVMQPGRMRLKATGNTQTEGVSADAVAA